MSVDVCLLLLVAVLVVASFLLDLDTFLRDRRMRRPQQWFADFYPAVRIGSTAKLAAATGLTTRYMRHVKRGTYVPDPRHWPAIQQVINNGHRM